MTQVTTKGQVTIPAYLRERHGLLPHAEVEFIEKDGDVVVRLKRGGKSRGQWLVEHLRGSATNREFTTDEIMAMTRGED